MGAARVLLPVLLAACGGCGFPTGPRADVARISWGSSFGECLGYCLEELQVTATEIRLTRSSWDALHYPAIVSTHANAPAAWDSLRSALAASRLQELAETYGCPDCADGGAEWVEVAAPAKRVTFEYGHAPARLEAVAAQLRRLRGIVSS